MPNKVKFRPWSDEQLGVLKDLFARKVSLARASVILKRPQSSVQIQARKLGTPFPGVRAVKAALRTNIAEAECRAGIRQ